jgi:hypothetical protein
MGGVEFVDGELMVDREPNELDVLASRFPTLLNEHGVRHVYVAGYEAIPTGRPRATQAVDVLLQRLDKAEVGQVLEELPADGMCGPAMPLDARYEMLANGDNIWVVPTDQVIPRSR